MNRADHNSAHLIDTVPAASRVQIHAVPWRKLNPMETKIEAKSGRTSGRYSNYSSLRGFNAIRVGRVRSQDICSGHGIRAEIAAKLVVICLFSLAVLASNLGSPSLCQVHAAPGARCSQRRPLRCSTWRPHIHTNTNTNTDVIITFPKRNQ